MRELRRYLQGKGVKNGNRSAAGMGAGHALRGGMVFARKLIYVDDWQKYS